MHNSKTWTWTESLLKDREGVNPGPEDTGSNLGQLEGLPLATIT